MITFWLLLGVYFGSESSVSWNVITFSFWYLREGKRNLCLFLKGCFEYLFCSSGVGHSCTVFHLMCGRCPLLTSFCVSISALTLTPGSVSSLMYAVVWIFSMFSFFVRIWFVSIFLAKLCCSLIYMSIFLSFKNVLISSFSLLQSLFN